MPSRLVALFLAVIIAPITSAAALAADLTIGSLNTLHLGWGSPRATHDKCSAIADLMNEVDVLFLQEVMQAPLPCNLPVGYGSACSQLKGISSYKEAYCFVYNTAKIKVIGSKDSLLPFSRPPFAILTVIALPNGKQPRLMWFVDIHSIFGKRVGPRIAEAMAGGAFMRSLVSDSHGYPAPAGGIPVAIGGDWNLPVTDSNNIYTRGFGWVAPINRLPALAVACTAEPTSLTARGVPSSPYDHIVVYGATSSGPSSCTTFPSSPNTPLPLWRANVSDHMAIYGGFDLK